MPFASIVVVAPARIEIFFVADRLNDAVDRDDRVGIENGVIEISAEKQSNVADYEFVGRVGAHEIRVSEMANPQMIPELRLRRKRR